MHFLFLLLLLRAIVLFWNARKSPVAFYQAVSSLGLYYEIQDLKKAFPYFGGFLFLHVVPSLLDIPVEGIVLFDVAAVIYFYFRLYVHPCTKFKYVCFR